ncbi:DUF2255 family protein [Microbacterium sp. NPDC057650]|uniref:DUF2255 family protein n=1 Tax=unclassified Microbacterium TaxID=2609290 RepID=UPI0036710F12
MASEELVTLLDETEVVAIVTRKQNGDPLVTPIWSMVVDGVPYIRSAYGEAGWWCRHVRAGRPAAFAMGDGAIAEVDRAAALELPRVEVTLTPIAADDAVQPAISTEMERKYAGAPRSSIDVMLTDGALGATFRVS